MKMEQCLCVYMNIRAHVCTWILEMHMCKGMSAQKWSEVHYAAQFVPFIYFKDTWNLEPTCIWMFIMNVWCFMKSSVNFEEFFQHLALFLIRYALTYNAVRLYSLAVRMILVDFCLKKWCSRALFLYLVQLLIWMLYSNSLLIRLPIPSLLSSYSALTSRAKSQLHCILET